MPKITKLEWDEYKGEPNPISGQNDGPFAKLVLGDAVGLSQFGIHLERLPPGSRSSHRHWHEKEDEFVYVISGQLVLIEDEEIVLESGDAAGWPGGSAVAHCLENRSKADAIIMVVGTRMAEEVVHYPDHEITLTRTADGHKYTRSDGSSIEPTED